MSHETFWLGRAAALLVVSTLVAFCVQAFGARESAGRMALGRYLAWLEDRLNFLRSTARPWHLVSAQLAAFVGAVSWVLLSGQWLPLLLLVPTAVLPKVLLDWKSARRVTRIEEQIEMWLNAVANALKASPSLGEAIASSVVLLPAPLREEIDLLVKENDLGTPLDQAFDNLQQKIPSRTLAGTLLALKIARRSGGDLPHMLESAAAALRELARLEGVVRTKTAESKAQALVIGIIPLPMIYGIDWLDRGFFDDLLGNFLGQIILMIAGVCWMAAVLIARKILQVDV